jgi:regulator of cell morphogenesis and NO signaling
MTQDIKVGDVVSDNIKTAHVFKKHGIDFCCGGGLSLTKACEKNNVNEEVLIQELNQVNQEKGRALDYQSWEASFLVDHIINVHHSYVKESIPLVMEYGIKVNKVHGHAYAQLAEILDLFRSVATELLQHMQKEEMILFPAIKELEQNAANAVMNAQMIMQPISVMEQEHEMAGDTLKKIRTLTNDYQPPEGACNTFRAFYSSLEEFEEDLHLHVHLENNVLFKKVANFS